MTGMASWQPLLVGAGKDPEIDNQNQANLNLYANQWNQLINSSPLSPAQAQAADPALVQILTQMQQLMQRPQQQSYTSL